MIWNTDLFNHNATYGSIVRQETSKKMQAGKRRRFSLSEKGAGQRRRPTAVRGDESQTPGIWSWLRLVENDITTLQSFNRLSVLEQTWN
jgi:hypothetical protein